MKGWQFSCVWHGSLSVATREKVQALYLRYPMGLRQQEKTGLNRKIFVFAVSVTVLPIYPAQKELAGLILTSRFICCPDCA
ncbi:hypothetical protein [Zobellella sp. DQSA1]|uniref:hypothetical protein n=1 Tax=Zobellella sp. DQSA1 TaxID=3342386 RepID=UPI0035C0FC46